MTNYDSSLTVLLAVGVGFTFSTMGGVISANAAYVIGTGATLAVTALLVASPASAKLEWRERGVADVGRVPLILLALLMAYLGVGLIVSPLQTEAIRLFLSWFGFFFLMWLALRRNWRIFVYGVLLGFGAVALSAMLTGVTNNDGTRLSGGRSPNLLGFTAAILVVGVGTSAILVARLSRPRRLLVGVVAMSVLVTILVASASRSALLSVIAGFTLALLLMGNRRALGWLSVGSLAVLVAAQIPPVAGAAEKWFQRGETGNLSDLNGRLGLWSEWPSYWAEHPVFGYGFGWREEGDGRRSAIGSTETLNLHNFLLQTLLDHGLVGLLMLVALLVSLVVLATRWRGSTVVIVGSAMFAVVLVNAFGNTTFLLPNLRWLGFLVSVCVIVGGAREGAMQVAPGEMQPSTNRSSRRRAVTARTGSTETSQSRSLERTASGTTRGAPTRGPHLDLDRAEGSAERMGSTELGLSLGASQAEPPLASADPT